MLGVLLASMIGVANDQIIVFCFRYHGVDAAAPKMNALFLFGTVSIALKRFSEGAHVHVVNRRLQVVAGFFPGQYRLFDGEHAADARAEIGVGLQVAGAHALDPGGAADWPAVGRAQQVATGWPAAGDQPFEFQTGDDVGIVSVTERVRSIAGGIKVGGPAAKYNCTDIDLFTPGGFVLRIDTHHHGNQFVRFERF